MLTHTRLPSRPIFRGSEKVRDRRTMHLPFARLGALAKVLLMIPNSNAAPEMTFSMVKKIFTEQRSQMRNSTLSALLKCKLNKDTVCTKFAQCECTVRLARVACTSYIDLCTSSTQEQVLILFRAFCCTAVSICCTAVSICCTAVSICCTAVSICCLYFVCIFYLCHLHIPGSFYIYIYQSQSELCIALYISGMVFFILFISIALFNSIIL